MKKDTKKPSKSLPDFIRGLRPISFMRELLVVILGILITFGINGWMSDSSRRNTLRETMQTIVVELESNRNHVQEFHRHFETEQCVFATVMEHMVNRGNICGIPADTLGKYENLPVSTREISLTDYGFSVLRNSNLIPSMKDMELTARLFECYGRMANLQKLINTYAARKEDAIFSHLYDSENLSLPNSVYEHWEDLLTHVPLRNFVIFSSPGYLAGILEECAEVAAMVEELLARIGRAYHVPVG